MVKKAARISDRDLEELFLRGRQGDGNALEHAVEAAEPVLARSVKMYQLSGHRAICHEDLLQEARIITINAIRHYDPHRGATPLGFVRLYVRTGLRDIVRRMEQREVGVLSLDAPVEDGQDRTLHDIVGAGAPMEAGEMGTLIARLPPGRKNTKRKLPDDHDLLTLVQQRKTTVEIGILYGVSREAVAKRLHRMRQHGIDVPTPATVREKQPPALEQATGCAEPSGLSTASALNGPEVAPVLGVPSQAAVGAAESTHTLAVPTWTLSNAGATDLLTDMATKLISTMARCGSAHMRLKIEVAPAETNGTAKTDGEQIGGSRSLAVPTWTFENAAPADQLAAMAAQLISSFSACATEQMRLKIEVSPTM